MKRVIFLLFTTLFLAACVTTSQVETENYNFAALNLEEISQIYSVKSPKLERANRQSVILKVNFNEYYLLVLERPLATRNSRPTIGISRELSTITAGVDRVSVEETPGQFYIIDKIYKLNGNEQAAEIKELLRKK